MQRIYYHKINFKEYNDNFLSFWEWYFTQNELQGKNLRHLYSYRNYLIKLTTIASQSARIIFYIINDCITYCNAISNHIWNNTDCPSFTGVEIAAEALPIHDPTHPPFTHNNLFI